MANSIEIIIKTLYQGKGAKDAAKDVDALGKAGKASQEQIAKQARAWDALNQELQTFAPLAGAAIAALSYSVVQAADAEREQAKLGAVLRATGGAAGLSAQQLNDMAAEMANLTGMSGGAITDAQALLLTFRQVGGEVFPQAMTAASDLAAVMGGDLNSAVLQLGKALEDPETGLTALRRSGVSFTREQQDMIKALVASGKTLEAQKMILAEVEKQVGGTAAAMGDTFYGAIGRAQEALENLGEAVGDDLLPGLTRITNGFADMLNAVSQNEDAIRTFMQPLGDTMRIFQGITSFGVSEIFYKIRDALFEAEPAITLTNIATGDLQYQLQGVATASSQMGGAFAGWKDSVFGLSDAIAKGGDALDTYIKRAAFISTLDSLFANGTPTDEEIKRVEEWGVGLGVIEAGTLDAFKAQEQMTAEMMEYSYWTKVTNDSLISNTKNAGLMAEAADLAMEDRKTTWTINVVGQGAVGLLGGIISGPGGGAFGAATTKRIQQGTGGSTIIGAQATGGPLQPVAMVGEQGPELIINGVVVPAGITRDLVRLGLRPGAQFATGGSLAALADSVAYNTSIQSKSSRGISAPRITSTTNTTAKTSSPGVTYSAPSMAAESVAQGITEAANAVTSAAIQSTTSAQMMAVAQQQQTAIITESNAELINEVRLMREELARVSPDFAQAVQRIVT